MTHMASERSPEVRAATVAARDARREGLEADAKAVAFSNAFPDRVDLSDCVELRR